MTTFGILEEDYQNLCEIFKNYRKISQVIIFGSRAKGNYKNGSDIDLALKGQNLSLKDITDLHLQIDDLWLPYKFDLIIFDNIADSDVVEHIQQVGKPFF